ncbi:MAG TPA: multiheme c-type cytochrome [Myxococcota bacterium]|nr:multiheme c-type cytochrome [Myxococcota bacterium]
MLLLLAGAALAADHRGWTEGTPAAGTGALLAPRDPIPVELPAWVVERVAGPTFVYYFSPACPHCQATIGEVVELSAKTPGVSFIGISTGRATEEEVSRFKADNGVEFDILIDQPQGFAYSLGARSTPTVLVLEPAGSGVVATDYYGPWVQGNSLLFQMRRTPEMAFAMFEEDVYQGDSVCGACHTEEARSLSLTHHAIAYQTIYMHDDQDDPECVACHVTGLGAQSGFQLGEHDSILAGVGCEACHSPGGPHDGAVVDPRTACVACHDAEHSIAFSVEKGLPHIDHFRANAMTDAQLHARWMELATGEAARPLLAFPEGRNLGPSACVSCHESEVAAWEESSHGEAIESLSRKERRQLDCVRCHGTPSSSGAPPASVEDYSAGVGCESCHGPGEAHVEAPSSSNIQGLGESCAECVIQAVCTSCHDKEWDAAWSLEARMESIKGHK